MLRGVVESGSKLDQMVVFDLFLTLLLHISNLNYLKRLIVLERDRTSDPKFRKLVLYPTELRGHKTGNIGIVAEKRYSFQKLISPRNSIKK